MTAIRHEVYKCDVCGIVAEVLADGAGEMICCGRPMRRLSDQAAPDGRDQHEAIAVADERGLAVRIAGRPHPMDARHFIEWIEVRVGDRVMRQYLRPGQPAEATFHLAALPGPVIIRACCSRHGLWEVKLP